MLVSDAAVKYDNYILVAISATVATAPFGQHWILELATVLLLALHLFVAAPIVPCRESGLNRSSASLDLMSSGQEGAYRTERPTRGRIG